MRWLLALCLLITACSKPPLPAMPHAPTTALSFTVSRERISRDIAYLTSPAREGRGVRTQGLHDAAIYIAAQMKELGLAPGAADGTYFSSVTGGPASREESNLIDEQQRWYQASRDFITLDNSPEGELYAEVVFAGYGAQEDFEGLEVAGKFVFLLVDEEEFLSKDRDLTRLSGYRKAVELGASAILCSSYTKNIRDDVWSSLNQQASPQEPAQRGPLAVYVRARAVRSWLIPPGYDDIDLSPRRLQKTFYLKIKRPPQSKSYALHNVIGVLESAQKNAKTIVLGAHYDHLGVRGDLLYAGADDNASGTAALLEIARVLASAKPRLPVRVIFCAFTDEERGLRGSSEYVLSEDKSASIEYMLNFDMVGRLRGDVLYLVASAWKIDFDSFERFSAGLDAANREVGLILTESKADPKIGDSDHSSFLNIKTPALHFFTGLHEDHHSPTDTSEKLNLEGITKIVELAVRLVYELAKEERKAL